MAVLSRRGFLSSSAGLTAAGVALAAAPSLAAVVPELASEVSADAAPTADELSSAGPLVVHVRDAVAGEVSVLSGESEVVLHDPAFVARIVAAASGHSAR
jgi:hypothetical protein